MTKILDLVHGALWGAPMLGLLLGVGLFLTVRTGFIQFRCLGQALRLFAGKLRSRETADRGISSFQALCTALGATVGTGNLVGVAGAVCLGGPGAVFWMWVCGFLGMATKYAEVTLAVRYRITRGREYLGGPMYMMTRGMNSPGLAGLYSFFGLTAAFGVGNATQINALVSAVNTVTGTESFRRNLGLGLLLAVLVGAMVLGGAKVIGRAAEGLVPLISGAYVLLCLGALVCRWERIPGALALILRGAFRPAAVTGGLVGSMLQSLRVGCARGVFSNEAGMGTASMAHAAAEVREPGEQGLLGIVEVFLDTIVICTLTALVILTSEIPIPYGQEAGAALTTKAFASLYGDWVGAALAGFLGCFAFATVLGWGLYGGRCSEFLFGPGTGFALAQTVTVVLGAVIDTGTLWRLAETVNGLMAIPNLMALVCLSPELVRLTTSFKRKNGSPAARGGNYADFHQCQSL